MGDAPLDLSGRRLDDPDFSGSRLHGPNFEGARITDAWLRDADVSGYIGGLRLNGVEVAPLVDAELDRQFPERLLLRANDPQGLAAGWEIIEARWRETVARAAALDPAQLDERVDGEWSFVETLRHLIMATDSWLRYLVRGEPRPYHPWGLAGSFLSDPASLGLDPAARPTLDEVLVVRRQRMDAVAQTIATVTQDELDRLCTPPTATGHPRKPHTVRACLHVILDEEWWHGQYANRDLAILEGSAAAR